MSTPSAPAAPPSCYRHPDRGTYVSCTRCQRYICPDCMRSAAVGHQCVECVDEGARSVQQPRTALGGRPVDKPIVTYVLIAANVVMFVLQMAVPGLQRGLFLWPAGIAAYDEFYRLLTSAFLHDGPTHILFNMWALWIIGPALERWLGRGRFVALYFLSALGGSVLVYLLTPINVPTLGASGAIFGLFGATLALSRKLNFDMRWIAGLIVINLVITFVVPSISWQGHVGGLLTGAAMGGVYAYAPRANRMLIQTGFSLALLAVFVALVWWRTTSLLAGAG
ncbi:rhomboid family intramembrane serine protease [Mycolicibacterium hodleri]|uniref:Rhomboid family intramembrane serine protease n=1 Tax=Mycolicibacterium hodleri TaxID=49897 RepID=A0A502EC07_9MYCO|nr:rhomboid family intramembrane serine protease [Mycolicibacterium hodleri]TPG35213.1 rhomboid family intramembrane serine protease [Mycolicibacterium hodleri]